uniref:Oncoprotein-induced transcript 3 protein-like n=1 Tax=Crassostrea virginica TaxID=6565 RepID=A0A8B8C762_CRAVI|nr:oncoprotein-induced transcript 3 protein-like [Crassostrea virginica]XP_022311558.1 oncoprotein-induced transcript 3 protein-like [Crassostrea virginica]
MSGRTVILVGYFLHLTKAVFFCNVADPCGQADSTQFHEPYARLENCPHNNNGFCDRYITPKWYRVNDDMLTQCPQLLSCGTLYPVWLNGTLPTISDGVVNREACKVGFDSCCTKTYNIQIKNCGSFYAYCLAALDTCPERYCFGEQGTCEIPTTSAQFTGPATNSKTAEPGTQHGHGTLEILLGIILAVLSVILFLLLFRQLIKLKKGRGKTGSMVDTKMTETRVKPVFIEKSEDPPS